MRKLNKNKGITLISLVITIIVMLILVGVSISMAVNGGLFNYAGKAVTNTKDAITAENKIGEGGVTVDGKVFTSIDDYIKETEKDPEKEPEEDAGKEPETGDQLAGIWVFKDFSNITTSCYCGNISFTSNSEEFTALSTQFAGGIYDLLYVTDSVSPVMSYSHSSGWTDTAYKTITITTTYDESLHADLLAFLNTYATKEN